MTNAAPLETETSTAGGEAMNRWSSFFAGIGVSCVVCAIVLAIILVVVFAF